jgi:hypothetical protein
MPQRRLVRRLPLACQAAQKAHRRTRSPFSRPSARPSSRVGAYREIELERPRNRTVDVSQTGETHPSGAWKRSGTLLSGLVSPSASSLGASRTAPRGLSHARQGRCQAAAAFLRPPCLHAVARRASEGPARRTVTAALFATCCIMAQGSAHAWAQPGPSSFVIAQSAGPNIVALAEGEGPSPRDREKIARPSTEARFLRGHQRRELRSVSSA